MGLARVPIALGLRRRTAGPRLVGRRTLPIAKIEPATDGGDDNDEYDRNKAQGKLKRHLLSNSQVQHVDTDGCTIPIRTTRRTPSAERVIRGLDRRLAARMT